MFPMQPSPLQGCCSCFSRGPQGQQKQKWGPGFTEALKAAAPNQGRKEAATLTHQGRSSRARRFSASFRQDQERELGPFAVRASIHTREAPE